MDRPRAGGPGAAVNDLAVAAYSATGAAWEDGAGAMYERLAGAVVGRSPVPLAGRLVLDAGAGTGAASRAIARAGGRPVALDAAVGMLAVGRAARPPAVAGDVLALPVRTGAVGGVVAAFLISHVDDPAAALREARRVTAPGGPVLASVYAGDDWHPVKDAVHDALRRHGWTEPGWYAALRARGTLSTPEGCAALARAAGLDAVVHRVRVAFPSLGPAALVAWRLGMAQVAPFYAALPAAGRAAVVHDALARLGPDAPVLVRSVLVIAAVA